MSRKKSKKRSFMVDALRVVALLLMVLTHVISLTFNHNEGSSIVFVIGTFTGTGAFITFLLLSGVSKYLSLFTIKTSERKKIHLKKVSIIRRSFSILLGYYFIAIISLFILDLGFNSLEPIDIAKEFARTLLLLRVPPYTEFLLVFVLFNLSTVIFRRVYVKLLENNWYLIVTGVVSYVLGSFLFTLDTGSSFLNLYKALFVGHESVSTFPLLQYFPIYLLGIYIGKILNDSKATKKVLLRLTGFLLAAFLLSLVTFNQTQLRVFDTSVYTGRFPPSIGFLVYGTLIAVASAYALMYIEPNKKSTLRKIVDFINLYIFEYFTIHTLLLLSIYYSANQYFGNDSWKYKSELQIIVIFLLVLTACTFIIVLWQSFLEKIKVFDPNHKILNVLYKVSAFIALISLLVYILVPYFSTQEENINADLGRVLAQNSNPDKWFDHNYKYRQQIDTVNIDKDALFVSNNWLYVEFDHKKYVSENSLDNTDGSDIQVVFINDSNEFITVPVVIENPNQANTRAYFEYENQGEYYIYYINHSSSNITSDKSPAENALSVNSSEAETHRFETELSSKWYLKEYADSKDITYTVNIPTDVSLNISAEYKILNSNIGGSITGQSNGNLQIVLDMNALDPGIYSIQATIYELDDSANTYKTYIDQIYVSYPVYVAWSIDWEGWGVSSGDLADIVSISERYGVPITHFFNPRIYIEDQFSTYNVSQAEAAYYTNWVLDRRSKGDDIGLHLHFYPDVLETAEVEVNDDAKLNGINRDETYIQGYSYDELTTIFDWALNTFEQNGITDVLSFRSGAWMSGEEVLRALSDSGLVIDSSARTPGLLNPASSFSTPIPWNISSTTKPYKPNLYDMNLNTEPQIDIWEIPNNGADSYWFSLEDLINRFTDNYSIEQRIVTEYKSVVYLSHPHGFVTYDSEKIRGIFNYIETYSYKSDTGPVVFETIETIYKDQLK